MAEIDDVVEEFLQDKFRLSKLTPFIQEETNETKPSVADFYVGQNILITGVTGFLGGLLLEKLLRSCPGLNTVYVLIRENKKNGQDPKIRLKKLFSSPIFSNIGESQLMKVVAVPSDISQPGLGLSAHNCQLIRDKVSVVFHVAASLNFNSPLPNAINTNVLGTRRILNLCHIIKNMKALVYVSTAYCNCTQRSLVTEQVYPTAYNTDKLVRSMANLSPEEISSITPKILGGHPNTYSFTKLLAENLILNEKGGIPVAIVRPSIVLGTLKEPVEGWVDNVHNGAFAFIAGAGKGVFRTILADGSMVADMVPCDLVVNLIITAAFHISYGDGGLKVFHMTSGTKNPLLWEEYASLTVAGIRSSPCLYPVWIPGAKCRTSLLWSAFKLLTSQYIPALALYIIDKLRGRKHILLGIQNKYVRGMLLSKYFTLNEWQFSTTNTDQLASSLSSEDRETFSFDVEEISWPEYLMNCVVGVKRFFHRENLEVDVRAHRHQTRMFRIDMAAKVMTFVVLQIIMAPVLDSGVSMLLAFIITCVIFYL